MALGLGLKPRAMRALFLLSDFVEQQNTAGSGKRFLDNFLTQLKGQAKLFKHIKLCNHPAFAKRNLKCVFIEKWVITLGMTLMKFEKNL